MAPLAIIYNTAVYMNTCFKSTLGDHCIGGDIGGQLLLRSGSVNLEMITSEVADLAFGDEGRGGRLHHRAC